MKVVIIVEVLPPHASSAAVQMYDLAKELVDQNFEVTILTASPNLKQRFYIENLEGIEIVNLKTPNTKTTNGIF